MIDKALLSHLLEAQGTPADAAAFIKAGTDLGNVPVILEK